MLGYNVQCSCIGQTIHIVLLYCMSLFLEMTRKDSGVFICMHNVYTVYHVYNHDPLYYIGHWLQKVLWDMKGKANGTLKEEKLFLYSAVSTDVKG